MTIQTCYARQEDAKRLLCTRPRPPQGDQEERYKELEAQMLAFMAKVLNHCPSSRQRSLALTKLEEAKMWAVAAIAQNETWRPRPHVEAQEVDPP